MSSESQVLSVAALLVGLIVGGLTSFAIFSGRVTALERDYNNLSKEVERLRVSIDTNMKLLIDALNRRGAPVRAWNTADDMPQR